MTAAQDLKVQCVVTAGGLGTRLRPLTERVPKSMALVLGAPFLHWLLAKLAAAGLNRFLLLTGYMADAVHDYFGDGARWGWRIEYSREAEPLGSGGALYAARGMLGEEYFYVNGDDYPKIDYAGMLRAFRDADCKAMVAVAPDPLGRLRVDRATGRVVAYDACGGLPELDCGTKLFRRTALDTPPPAVPFNVEPALWPGLIREGELAAYFIAARPMAIDTIEQLRYLEQRLRDTGQPPPG